MTTLWCLISPILMIAVSAVQTETSRNAAPPQCVNGTFAKFPSADEGYLCVADCGPGFFADIPSRTCNPCIECLTCAGSAHNCTSCSEPNFLLGNRCVMNCGSQLSRGPARSRLRLRGGKNMFEGRVEILYEDVWGSICDDQWDLRDAEVVCRELQLGSAVDTLSVSQANLELAPERMPIHLDDVACHGTESELEFCPNLVWGRHNCGHYEDAVVRCSGPDLSRLCVRSCGDGYYRVQGTNKCELCSPGCLTCSERPERCLSCQAPRFLQDERCVKNCGNGRHGNTDSRTCEPCHENCNNCHDGPTNSVCSSCKDHLFLNGQQCVDSCDPSLSKNLAIRLVGGTTVYEGRVEVYIDGEWGTVCDNGWDINDAEVVCRELGYGSVLAAYPSSAYGRGTGPIALSDVKCNGNESELVHCVQNSWRDNRCSHNEDAGVRCEGQQSIVTSWGKLVPTLTLPGATGKCLDSCGTGYYLPAYSQYDCVTCSSNCLSCEVLADRCTSCKPPKFLKGLECVDSCGPTEYGNTLTNRCELCDVSNCNTCQDGPRNDQCKSCPGGKVLKGSLCVQSCGPDMYSQSGVCQTECNQGNYGNPVSFVCQACSSECLTCNFVEELRLVCKTCRAPKVLYNGECVDSCPGTMLLVPMDPSVVPFSNEIRLVGGRDQLEGRLEVFHDGQWGTVCSDYWSFSSARVACKQLHLGLADSIILSTPRSEPGQGIIWLDDVKCRGTETQLDDCQHNEWGVNNCNHLKDVILRCSGPGIRQCVETCPQGYFAQSQTGQCLPCLDGCLHCENSTAYRCLECPPGTLLQGNKQCVDECAAGYHPVGSVGRCSPCSDICATCVNHADNCTSCKRELILEGHTCVPQCDGYKLVLTNQVRLVGGDSPLEGRVEVAYQGSFGTICDDQWGLEDANVVCAELGLGRALMATEKASHGHGSGAIVLDNVECRGDEPSIFACQHDGLGVHDCQHNEDAGVVCSGPVTSNICIQRSACSSGLFVDGMICRKCSHNCKTCSGSAEHCISCPDGQYLSQDNSCIDRCPLGSYGDAARNCQPCSEDCLGCSGSASECTSCPSPLFLQSGRCVTACASNMVTRRAPPDIRLVNGRNPFSGRVEVLYNGAWGTVCDDSFNLNDAKVICRQLQMGSAISAYSNAHFGEGAGSVVLDQLACNGDEESLSDCMGDRLGVGEVDCDHTEDAGVQCSGPGMAQHCLEACDQGYYATSARVCEHCNAPCHSCEGSPSDCLSCVAPLFLINNTCIDSCPSGHYGNIISSRCEPCAQECQECFDGESEDVCMSCKQGFYLDGSSCIPHCGQASVLENILPKPTSSAPIRLAGGRATEGRVEILHEEKWGTVCADDWDEIDGEVVCQQLGLGHLLSIPTSSAYGSVSSDTPIWLDSVECKGWEFALNQCGHEGWGVGHCRVATSLPGGSAAVKCSGSSNPRPTRNICRSINRTPCQRDTCSSGTACIDLEGGNSVCTECPKGYIGTGNECTMVASARPEFELTPEDRLAMIGTPASLRCRVKGRSAPTVAAQNWLKDGKPIPQVELESRRIRILNFGTLFIRATRREDTGNYTCTIKNTQGKAAASATLTVEEPPQIMQKRDAIVATSDTAMLSCVVLGLPPSTVSWRRAGKPVNSADRFTVCSGNGTLVIEDVRREDEGEYQCFAENKRGSAHTTVTLTVQEPPKFTAMPKEVTEVEQGEVVILQCQAQGKPLPTLHWKKDGNELPHVENRYFVSPVGDLRLENVEIMDMGVYYCIATNSVQTKSLSAKLLVIGPPQFVTTPSNRTVAAGETLLLKCEVIGAKNPVISWEKDGQPITNGDHYSVHDGELQINSVNVNDEGEYKCIGSNTEGKVESTAYVGVHALPPVFGKPQTVGGIWIYITIIALLVVIIFVIVIVYLRCRFKEKAQFSHSRLNRSPKNKSPKKLVPTLGVKFNGGSNNYVEIDKQKAKEEREMQTRGIIEDVEDVDIV